MHILSPGQRRLVRQRACVFYDRASGTIRHIQHVMVMEGGHDPDDAEVEAMGRRALEKRGRKPEAVAALHIGHDALKPFTAYRVDVQRKALVEVAVRHRGP